MTISFRQPRVDTRSAVLLFFFLILLQHVMKTVMYYMYKLVIQALNLELFCAEIWECGAKMCTHVPFSVYSWTNREHCFKCVSWQTWQFKILIILTVIVQVLLQFVVSRFFMQNMSKLHLQQAQTFFNVRLLQNKKCLVC